MEQRNDTRSMASGGISDVHQEARPADDDDRERPVRDWLTAGHLIPLKKPDGRVRPIVVREAFVRLISGWKLSEIALEEKLSKEQFGVGSRGGVEAVIHSIRSAIDHGTNGLLKLDFQNAFNTTSRTRMYEAVKKDAPQLAPLFWNTYRGEAQLIAMDDSGNCVTVRSKTGGRQGDPMMPFVFSLAIKPMVEELAAKFAKEDAGWPCSVPVAVGLPRRHPPHVTGRCDQG